MRQIVFMLQTELDMAEANCFIFKSHHMLYMYTILKCYFYVHTISKPHELCCHNKAII